MTHKVLKSQVSGADFPAMVRGHCWALNEWQTHMSRYNAQKDKPRPKKPEWSDFAGEDDPTRAFTKANKDWEAQRLLWVDPVPRPMAHLLVEASVRSETSGDGEVKFTEDYEVVNDDPTPDQVLRSRKNDLLQRVAAAEAAAIERLQQPPGRRRLSNLLESDIRAADAARVSQIVSAHRERVGVALEQHQSTVKRLIDAHQAKLADWEKIMKKPKPGVEIPPMPATPELPRVPPEAVMTDLGPEVLRSAVEKLRPQPHTDHLRDQERRRQHIEAVTRRAAQVMSDVEDLSLDNIDGFQVPTFEEE